MRIVPNRPEFIPARPSTWMIKAAQELTRLNLAMNNPIHLEDGEIEHLRKIPQGNGIVLISNHADEVDPRVCLEVSRRSGKQFITMCNREAFDEHYGMAGWALQRLGLFSVKRGAHDQAAKNYAVEVIKQGDSVLVIFPEGEIFYLNEKVQPFHTGAIDIALKAISERRASEPQWTTFLVPMAIKYHYVVPMEPILQRRVADLESRLGMPVSRDSIDARVRKLQVHLLQKADREHQIDIAETADQHLTQAIVATEKAILQQIAEKEKEELSGKTQRIIDESWRLGARIRDRLEQQDETGVRNELQHDLSALNMVAHLSSWRPHYYTGVTSNDRLAEAVLKLEREVYGIKRPKRLARRKVFLKIAQPVDLGLFAQEYETDAHGVRSKLTQDMQNRIQMLIDILVENANASIS